MYKYARITLLTLGFGVFVALVNLIFGTFSLVNIVGETILYGLFLTAASRFHLVSKRSSRNSAVDHPSDMKDP
jgi:hypothetical protein